MPINSHKGNAGSNPRCRAHKRAKLSEDIEDAGRHLFDVEETLKIRKLLLEWYDENHRILPWRRNAFSKVKKAEEDTGEEGVSLQMPQQQFMYGIWISEVMSQQTQVPRAAAYFRKWIAKWPTVQKFKQELARADMEEVNTMWAGLGYYRRARYLLDGAKYIMDKLDGVFPGTSVELQNIPGVGAYTGAAMASIAAGEQVAVVDANVMRILARLRCLDWNLKSVKRYSTVAEVLVDPERPGDFNQAVMELGASICTIHRPPSCITCPIQNYCLAYKGEAAQGQDVQQKQRRVTDYPVKAVKPARREEFAACCVVKLLHSDGTTYYLLVRRPATGLLAGLYEMPLQLVSPESSKEEQLVKMDKYLSEILDVSLPDDRLEIVEREFLGKVSHTFSHIQLTLRVQTLILKGYIDTRRAEENKQKGLPAMKWLSPEDLLSEGLSSSVAKVFKFVDNASKSSQTSVKKFFKPVEI